MLPPFAPALPAPTALWPLPADHALAEPEAWNDRQAVRCVSFPVLGHYPAPPAIAQGCAVVVCPGGGYHCLAMEHEGITVALWLNTLGVDAFVLKSRLRDYGHPAPLLDVCAALRRVRDHAASLGLDPRRVGIVGFSAGGHLAATACTAHASPAAREHDEKFAAVSARPDFALLLYPVISLEPPHAHAGSREALLGPTPNPELVAALSLHHRVDAATPPTLLLHARDDPAVPVENSRAYFAALRAAGVESGLHEFAEGGHGFGLGRGQGEVTRWPGLCAAWMRAGRWIS